MGGSLGICWEVFCRGGTGGLVMEWRFIFCVNGGDGRCFFVSWGEGVWGGGGVKGEGLFGKKVLLWLFFLFKGGGWRCSGEFEKILGVFIGFRGGNKGGFLGGFDIEVRFDIE